MLELSNIISQMDLADIAKHFTQRQKIYGSGWPQTQRDPWPLPLSAEIKGMHHHYLVENLSSYQQLVDLSPKLTTYLDSKQVSTGIRKLKQFSVYLTTMD